MREREKRFEQKIEAKTGSAERNVRRMRIETRDVRAMHEIVKAVGFVIYENWKMCSEPSAARMIKQFLMFIDQA